MSRVRKLSSCFLSLLLGAVSLPVWSQNKASNESEIDRLAARTADRVAKTAAHNVLVLTVQGCLLNPDICGSLDQQICTELRMRSPGIQLFSRADLLTLLPKHGLLPVDAYTGAAEAVAPDLGAEVMVTESLSWLEDGYEAEIRLTDLARHKGLENFKAKLERPASDSSTEPLIFREPSDGPALIVERQKRKGLFPSCQECLEPAYTEEARAKKIQGLVLLVITITEQGTAEHISTIRGLPGGLTEAAVARVRGWRFKPAVGPDGKPLAARTPIEVNFVLRP